MNNIAEQHKNASGTEEITLYSAMPEEFEDQQQSSEEKVATLKFAQLDKKRSLGKKFLLYDNKQLSVSDFTLKAKRQYWVNLGFVNPKALAKWHIAWPWFWTSLAFSLGAAAAAAIAVRPLFGIERWSAIGVCVILAGLSVLCAFTLVRKTRHVLSFYSANGNIPVMEVLYNNPDRSIFNQFKQQLLERINSARQLQHLAKDETLAAELAMHRQLKEHKIITTEEYEAAKARLFSMHNR